MHLEKALEILVKDWRNLHEEGGTKLSVENVVGQLDVGSRNTLSPELKPEQIAGFIMNDLRKIPGALENTEKFMAQFASPEELLEEIDLDCLVSDLLIADDDDL
jgi:2-keto-3-deoxy-6-phosphogluconate aldolase